LDLTFEAPQQGRITGSNKPPLLTAE
jgi:ATP-dependent Clp protease ATP-binding subunit ClpA